MNMLLQYFITAFIAMVHPFFVSVIDVNHNQKEKSLEVSVRIFTEDLETVLKNKNHTTVDLTKGLDKAKNDKLIAQYIQAKMQFKVDGTSASLNYLGYEIQQESVWCYFEIANIPSFKKLDVNCNLLYEWQAQQMNIFHVKEKGTEKSYKLDNPKTQALFEF